MKLWQRGLQALDTSKRSTISTVDDWILFGGHQYPLGLPQTIHGDKEPPPTSFEGYATRLFGADPVVWSAEQVRKAVFSQARFQYRRRSDGGLFGDASLRLLEKPWPGGRTSKLLTRMILHADLGGNSYVLDLGRRLQLMRPDYVTIVMGSQLEPDNPYLAEDAELIGFMYLPQKSASDRARFYLPDEVAHFAPMPDPLAHFRGISWLTPVVREIQGDKQTTEHKLKFFEQGATPNVIIRFDPSQTLAQVKAFKELVEENHQGLADAYKTMYLGGGADATVVGSDLQQLDFAKTIGKSETRILMAAGVHPVIAGASEGMQGASLNAGNFMQIRRLFSDVHLQDLWNEAAGALETLVPVPPGAELAVDSRNIPFLQDDGKDEAEIQRSQSRTIAALVREGYTPDSVVAAVTANDMNLLVHSGLMSVQLQPPLTGDTSSDDEDQADDDAEDDEDSEDDDDGD